MRAGPVLALAMLCALSAHAEDLAAPALPMLALDPPAPSPWSGLYVGSEMFAISQKGTKGLVGGGAFVGYNHEFTNNWVVGIEGSTGFAPSCFQCSPFGGYNYAATNVKIGYDMGRWMPFVTAGVALAKPNIGFGAGFSNAANSVNNLLNTPSSLRAFGSVGAGVDYAVTDKLTVGVSVSATTKGPGFWPQP